MRSVWVAVCLLVMTVLMAMPTSGPGPFQQAAGAPSARAQPAAAWTFLVYLDADNNLDPWAYVDIAEMEAVGSTASVNVVVLWDKLDGPADLVQVQKGSVRVVSGFSLNGKEANMGSGDTLKAFVSFVVSKFPADHYALDLWDHGDDFRGFAWDDHPNFDGSPGDDFLTHDEIVQALSDQHFDLVAFDGCVMSNLEVSYEYAVRGLKIDYLVASEIYIPNQGFDYAGLLAPLASQPTMGAYDFAKAIVDSYMVYYSGGGWQVGLSVLRMSEVPELVASVGRLADALEADMAGYRDYVGTARGNAMLSWSMYGWEAFVDLPTFAASLGLTLGSDPTIAPLLEDLRSHLSATIAYVRNTHALDVKGAGGVGVFFPGSYGSFTHNLYWHADYFERMQFARQVWLDFLHAYWGTL